MKFVLVSSVFLIAAGLLLQAWHTVDGFGIYLLVQKFQAGWARALVGAGINYVGSMPTVAFVSLSLALVMRWVVNHE